MFCPYCAAETTKGLNYCNRCGGNLAPLTQQGAQETRPTHVSPGTAWAAALSTTAVVVIGLGMIFPITSELANRHVGATALVWISLFVALAVVSCAAMLLRFWSLLFGVARPSAAPAASLNAAQATDTRELGSARFDSLNPAPAPSVTEQTTRTLEPVKKERRDEGEAAGRWQ